jgi:hypothetical protein
VSSPAACEDERKAVGGHHRDEEDGYKEDHPDGHGNAGELQHESQTWCSDEKLRNRVVKRCP